MEAKQNREVTAQQVLDQLARVAFSDMGEVVNPDGSLRGNIPPEAMAAVEQLKVTESPSVTTCQVKLASKLKALELLGRHMDLFGGQGKKEPALPVILEGEERLAE